MRKRIAMLIVFQKKHAWKVCRLRGGCISGRGLTGQRWLMVCVRGGVIGKALTPAAAKVHS